MTSFAKDVPLGGFVDMPPHLGGQIHQNPNFGGVNRRFPAELVKSKNMHRYYENYCVDSNQILYSDKDHKMPFMVVQTHTRAS